MNSPAYFTRWRTIYQTANPLPGAPLDPVSRWMPNTPVSSTPLTVPTILRV